MKISETLLGPDHTEVGFALSGLAQLAETNGKPQEAEHYYLRTLRIFETRLQAGHPNVAVTQLNLGGFYRRQNDCPKSEPLLRSGLNMMLAALPSHSSVANGRQHLAHCVLQAGNASEAESLLLSARQGLEKLGPGHPRIRSIERDLGRLSERRQRPDDQAPVSPPPPRDLSLLAPWGIRCLLCAPDG